MEHASSYLAIQNIRFKDKFEFQIEADPALLKYLCPKLSIQPLLENAIYHGMEGMYEDGEITIRIYDRDGDIGIDVADNGPGMTQETIDHIMHNKSNFEQTRIGDWCAECKRTDPADLRRGLWRNHHERTG